MEKPYMIFYSGHGLCLTIGDLRRHGLIPSVDNPSPDIWLCAPIGDYNDLSNINIKRLCVVNNLEYKGLTCDKLAHFITIKL